jgi:cytidylate kinase
MIPISSTEHLASALARATAGKENAEASDREFTLALARQTGAGGTAVGRLLGERLGWPVYDDELLEHLAQEMKLQPHLLRRVDERHSSFLWEFVESFTAQPPITESLYVRYLTTALEALAAQGGCVIVGRGAALLLDPQTTVRVRLIGRLEDRVTVMSQQLGVSREKAEQYVETTDRERIRFALYHFHQDPSDPGRYDLLLNSSQFSVPECADLVLAALRVKRARAPVHELATV